MASPDLPATLNNILIILNPAAGQDDPGKMKSAIRDYFDGKQSNFEIRETKGAGDALEWAKTAEGFDLVIVAGGDGTVMEAMSGMIENPEPLPLAQLALGTANLLTRALAIPIELEAALDLATKDGVVVKMDVGYLESHDRYFAIVAGAGWDADLIHDASREMKDRLGFFAYVISGIKNLFHRKTSRIEIEIDGKSRTFWAQSVMLLNVGEIHGTGIAVGDGVSPHDGKLNLAVASARGLGGILKLLWRFATKSFDDSEELRYITADSFSIKATPPMRLEIDGEVIGSTPLVATAVPNAVRLVVAREYAESKSLEFASVGRNGSSPDG